MCKLPVVGQMLPKCKSNLSWFLMILWVSMQVLDEIGIDVAAQVRLSCLSGFYSSLMFQKTVLKPWVFQLIYSQLWATRVQVYWRSTMMSSVKTNLESSQILSFWNEKTECVLWLESFCRCLLPPRARLVGRPELKMLEGKLLFPLLRYFLQDELQIVCETCFDGRYFYVDHLSCLLSGVAHWHFFFSNARS